jgi:hypothetical protein
MTARNEVERDGGQDKTDKVEDKRLVEEALKRQNMMPFYESEPNIFYSPRVKKED